MNTWVFLFSNTSDLYEKRSPLYKDKNVKQNAWREIAGELGITEENVQNFSPKTCHPAKKTRKNNFQWNYFL